MHSEAIRLSPEVKRALVNGQPVVALESTIIAHGMPYPTNFEVALAVEKIVREAGAIPATLGILDGQIRAGLSEDEIHFFAQSKGIMKAIERDIPLVVARKAHAAVTAGSSIAIAAAAGIPIFVTGGIGGVGPMANTDFDISSDLIALAQYPILTVCSGTKAFMDIPATLEYLETHRVSVVSYQTEYFPMFYSRSSGVKVDWIAQTPGEIADFMAAKLYLGMEGGLLVGVPVPEAAALPVEETRAAIDTALARIRAEKIIGKAVTPFLLAAIKEATESKSLDANIALIKNNAAVGAQVAVELAKSLSLQSK